jgi:hypothetical protein
MLSGFLDLSVIPPGPKFDYSYRPDYFTRMAPLSGVSLEVEYRVYCGGRGRCVMGWVPVGQAQRELPQVPQPGVLHCVPA